MNQENAMPLKQSRKQDMSIGLPGVHLRQAREARRLTQQDVALQLRLSLTVIDAIEHDDYTKLPGQIFVRGYLRAYARLLDLSGDDIIESFNQLEAAQQTPPPLAPAYTTAPTYTEATVSQSDGKLLRWFVYLVVVLTLILLVQWWMSENPSANLTVQLQALFWSIWPSALTVQAG